jgi:hypothetical protein
VASEPKLARDLRRDRMWRRLRVTTGVVRVWLELEPLRGAGSRAVPLCLPSETGLVGALRGDPQGARLSALARPAASRGHLPEQGRVETCLGGHCRSRPGPGRSERAGHSTNRMSRQFWFQRRASRRSARLKARTRRGQAACQSLPALGKRAGQPATFDATV